MDESEPVSERNVSTVSAMRSRTEAGGPSSASPTSNAPRHDAVASGSAVRWGAHRLRFQGRCCSGQADPTTKASVGR